MLQSNAWYVCEPTIFFPLVVKEKQRYVVIISRILILCIMVQHLVGLQAYTSLHADSILHDLSCIETRFELDVLDDLIQPIICQNQLSSRSIHFHPSTVGVKQRSFSFPFSPFNYWGKSKIILFFIFTLQLLDQSRDQFIFYSQPLTIGAM